MKRLHLLEVELSKTGGSFHAAAARPGKAVLPAIQTWRPDRPCVRAVRQPAAAYDREQLFGRVTDATGSLPERHHRRSISKKSDAITPSSRTKVEGGTLLKLVETGFDSLPPSRRKEAFRMNSGGWDQQIRNIEKHVSKT